MQDEKRERERETEACWAGWNREYMFVNFLRGTGTPGSGSSFFAFVSSAFVNRKEHALDYETPRGLARVNASYRGND